MKLIWNSSPQPDRDRQTVSRTRVRIITSASMPPSDGAGRGSLGLYLLPTYGRFLSMPKIVDLTGRRFGRLEVLALSHINEHRRKMWRCRCDCGAERVVASHHLTEGTSTSCGCYAREAASKRQKINGTTHGRSRTPIYKTWVNMKQRCANPRHPLYQFYGARGVTVCARWLDSFEAFAADMGERPDNSLSLDRIDVTGSYEPGNCRWATIHQQANNTRLNRYLEFGGKRLTITQWSRETGLAHKTIAGRVKHGWPVDKALTIPASRSNVHLHALNFARRSR